MRPTAAKLARFRISRAWAMLGLLALVGLSGGCHHYVKNKAIPRHGIKPTLDDFIKAPSDTAVLHYYGVGGWGIRWKSTYLLTAPYFSNHGFLASSVTKAIPRWCEIEKGFDGTPYWETNVILVGHGHVDHASDIPAYPFWEMNGGKRPKLIADESTINQLGDDTLARVDAIPVGGHGGTLPQRICPTADVCIQPVPWAHAPHFEPLDTVYLTVGNPQGFQKERLKDPPEDGADWLVGRTWGYVIELMSQGAPVFRIHYVDAAANPRFVGGGVKLGGPVDAHIGCVPGFDYVGDYPSDVIDHYRVGYVLAGHWENFFKDRHLELEPVPLVLDDDKMDAFVDSVEATIGDQKRLQPINKCNCKEGETCGPHSEHWAVPIPGETFWFRPGKVPDEPICPKNEPSSP